MINSPLAIQALGVASLALLAIPLLFQLLAVVRGSTSSLTRPAALIGTASGIIFLGFLFLRPHEHTFTGLDVSGYRLMAKSLSEGRGLKEVDRTLLEVPPPLRNLVTYRPAHHKPTRDLSFRISSMKTGETEPFFYPFLPLAMVGFDTIFPGAVRDYLVPVTGLILFFSLLTCSLARAGSMGLVLFVSCVAGTLYPVWFFRGSFPECLGLALIAASLLSWIEARDQPSMRFTRAFSLGLSVSLHPLMIVLALPILMGTIFLDRDTAFRSLFVPGSAFLAGTVPLFLMTHFITAPYGNISLGSLGLWWQRSMPMRAVLITVAASLAIFLIAFLFRQVIIGKLNSLNESRPSLTGAGLLILWVAPALLSTYIPAHGMMIKNGLQDLWSGLRFGYGALFIAIAAATAFSRSAGRARIAATVAFFSLPVFLYLKGTEQTGLWSQRRLLPFVVLVIVISTPVAADHFRRLTARIGFKPLSLFAAAALILAAGLSNPLRWPAPFLVRQEKGADRWVEHVSALIGDVLTVFEYHPYSIPFAVRGSNRVLGFGPHAFERIDPFWTWLRKSASEERILVVSPYAGGWMERGVSITEGPCEEVLLGTVHAKRAFPAVKRTEAVSVCFFEVSPERGSRHASMGKSFDGGEFGLRPPWGRRDIPIRTDGKSLPAFWSREGSGIIGPVPPPGSRVRVELLAGAFRRDGLEEQVVRLKPPWQGEPLRLSVPNGFSRTSGVLRRPPGATNYRWKTGVYRMYSQSPYNPARAEIRGFNDDLGVLIHELRMEVQSGPRRVNQEPEGRTP